MNIVDDSANNKTAESSIVLSHADLDRRNAYSHKPKTPTVGGRQRFFKSRYSKSRAISPPKEQLPLYIEEEQIGVFGYTIPKSPNMDAPSDLCVQDWTKTNN